MQRDTPHRALAAGPGLGLGLVLLAAVPAAAQQPAVNGRVNIDQQQLLEGGYRFRKVVESGRHFFTNPFDRDDGFGEGRVAGGTTIDGPRRELLKKTIAELKARVMANDVAFLNFPEIPFLRLNGLDSQSCFECHNSIGTDRARGTRSRALTRKEDAVGGAAGFASNAFINGGDTPPGTLPDPLFNHVRNPPHTFGSGYAQELAEEMTMELLTEKMHARTTAVGQPGKAVSQRLSAKGVDFGTYVVTYKAAAAAVPAERRRSHVAATLAEPGGDFVEDFSGLKGLSTDLVVRPFQWKGIASNGRNFVRDALDFHFSMQPVEKYGNEDQDRDDKVDEMSVGNVTALTAFTLSLRPPYEVTPEGEEQAELARRGRRIFEGKAAVKPEHACASCHVASLRVVHGRATIHTPPGDAPTLIAGRNKARLSAPQRSTADLPVYRRFRRVLDRMPDPGRAAAGPDAMARALREALVAEAAASSDYAFDLTSLRPSVGGRGARLAEDLPRLPRNDDGTIDVPLFSDLKRHEMGDGLKEAFPQQTDVQGIFVPAGQFLTRPLWGVADTGPWLHDGRATTLEEAILMHESPGSEANDAIAAFRGLSYRDRRAVLEFLRTLRLPGRRARGDGVDDDEEDED